MKIKKEEMKLKVEKENSELNYQQIKYENQLIVN